MAEAGLAQAPTATILVTRREDTPRRVGVLYLPRHDRVGVHLGMCSMRVQAARGTSDGALLGGDRPFHLLLQGRSSEGQRGEPEKASPCPPPGQTGNSDQRKVIPARGTPQPVAGQPGPHHRALLLPEAGQSRLGGRPGTHCADEAWPGSLRPPRSQCLLCDSSSDCESHSLIPMIPPSHFLPRSWPGPALPPSLHQVPVPSSPALARLTTPWATWTTADCLLHSPLGPPAAPHWELFQRQLWQPSGATD